MKWLVALVAAGVASLFGPLFRRALAARGLSWGGKTIDIETTVTIHAPLEDVWAEIADIPGQPRWMRDMKSVRILTPGPVGPGTRAEARLRIFGIGAADPVEVIEWDPPRRFAIRHVGSFQGMGEIDLDSDGRARTVVRWRERLAPPMIPRLAVPVMEPLLRRVFSADLDRLRQLVEQTGQEDGTSRPPESEPPSSSDSAPASLTRVG